MPNERIRYCPKDGRVTDEEYAAGIIGVYGNLKYCEHCRFWFYRMGQFVAKRYGES